MSQKYKLISKTEMEGKESEQKFINDNPIKNKEYISSQWRFF